MSKQSEIREGIAGLINLSTSEETKRTISNAIILYLHREGVVIKVDRELPQWKLEAMGSATENAIYKVAQKDMASYVAVEPLIDKG